MPFPGNYTRIWVRGRFVDLGKMANGDENYGTATACRFRPSPSVLLDSGTDQVISTGTFTITPSAQDGYFAIQLPATDDPDINPTDWTYGVTDPAGRSYNIVVPIDTPALNSPGDVLDGEQVIDLVDIVPGDAANPGTVQLVTGATGATGDSVTAAEVDEDGHLQLTITDSFGAGTVVDAGPVVGTSVTAAEVDEDGHLQVTLTDRFGTDTVVDTGSVIGPQGEQGIQGEQGETGPAGSGVELAPSGEFPVDVGSANSVGESEYAARADHRHGERDATVDRIDDLEARTTVETHEAASDPHAQYLTQTEADALYAPVDGGPVDLTDGATPALDASLGGYFRLAAGGDRTIAVPSNPTDGQAITIEHLASGAARTLALNTGTGGFLFGTTITALDATASGKRDFIRAIYNSTLNKWLVVGYAKGF